MTVKNADRDAIVHGKITEKPLRERPSYPTWAIKLVMAVTGLIFGLYVLVHMVGNLKLYMPDHDGIIAINEYGEFLRSMGAPIFPRESILWIFRIVLLAALVLHVHGAFALSGRSGVSRGKFKRTNLVGGMNSFTSRSMLITGIVLLLFVIFHVLDLTMGVTPAAADSFAHGEIYANMVASFSRWPVALFYIVAMVVLFLHLSHGIWLAVSDLGITGKRWRKILLVVAYLVPAIVMIGNISMPLSIALGWIS
ncbi:succinate dehydrogenase cytochrome b subunit [Corynebacterium alimapuense]|uniref:Succinate dehydrogenase n=1 Tax=Corynebacterium alimapuense TaxID=1576874 RepID=A0A3M8K8W9_9CORY|nr:succinate dehydrogenase cytochrome b subunit [Corynebacterium alimapuense]RNE48982.1 succinate dehydrogenase [Corynebacterium alimapuense]